MTFTKPAARAIAGGLCVLAYARLSCIAMPRLPDYRNAIVELGKLQYYCLSPSHPRGRHKARVFREALGLTEGDADWLRAKLLEALATSQAELQTSDRFGTRWYADIAVRRQQAEAVVRTMWIIRTGERQPRLVTCWVV